MYIVTHKFTQHVKKNQFFFLRGIILPLSPLIIYEIYGKKYQLDFELKAVLHFNFQNHFYL
jgi:hypothetical protein